MPADPIAPFPLVRRGDRIFPVRPLQQLLRARNHPVAVDGNFGPNTESAVKAFQQSKGLAADGIVGPQTWGKLVIQIKKGSTGDAVRALQEVMKFHDQSDGEGPEFRSTASSARAPMPSCAASRPPWGLRPTASSARSRGARWSAACCPAELKAEAIDAGVVRAEPVLEARVRGRDPAKQLLPRSDRWRQGLLDVLVQDLTAGELLPVRLAR